MKKGIIFSLFLLSTWHLFSITRTDVHHSITSVKYDESCAIIENFISKNTDVYVYSIERYRRKMEYNIFLTQELYQKYKSSLSSLGYLSESKENTVNIDYQINIQKDEIQFLKTKLEDYEKMALAIDKTKDNYLSFWREIQELKDKIRAENKRLEELEKQNDGYYLQLALYQDTPNREEYAVTTYANIPSFHYTFWVTEKPLSGLTNQFYQGFHLKYMFTRGKNAIYLGAYKPVNIAASDSTSYRDIFTLGFGQDFYSRYLGRGLRTFFNPYTGYVVEAMLLSKQSTKVEFNFAVTPTIGMDIYKGKFVIWDVRVGYILPIINNKNLRGFQVSSAIGVVF